MVEEEKGGEYEYACGILWCVIGCFSGLDRIALPDEDQVKNYRGGGGYMMNFILFIFSVVLGAIAGGGARICGGLVVNKAGWDGFLRVFF